MFSLLLLHRLPLRCRPATRSLSREGLSDTFLQSVLSSQGSGLDVPDALDKRYLLDADEGRSSGWSVSGQLRNFEVVCQLYVTFC